MGRIFLVRHGESEGNLAARYTPHPEIPLTEAGRLQAGELGRWLAGRYTIRRIVSSPYARARQTAERLALALDCDVTFEPDLRERHYGELTGQPYETPRAGYDRAAYWDWQPAGGESLVEVLHRSGAALDRVRRDAGVDDVVVVSHGAVMLALWRHVTGTWAEPRVVPNAGVVEVEHRANAYLGARHLGPAAAGRESWRRGDPVA